MFISSIALQHIHIAVIFLTVRMKKPDEDNWREIKLVLKYLKVPSKLKLVLSVGDMPVVKWWVDASYVVHEDFRGHTGGMMSPFKGVV